MQMEPAFDDWPWLATAGSLLRENGIFSAIVQAFAAKTGIFWRPLNVLPQIISYYSIAASQLLKLFVIVGYSGLMISVVRSIGMPRFQAALLAAVLLLHQCLVILSSEIDYWGDVLCSLALLTLFLVSMRFGDGEIRPLRFVLYSACLASAAMLAKEAGVIAFLTPAFIWILRTDWKLPRIFRTYALSVCVCFALALLYLWLRSMIGVPLSTYKQGDYYALHFGWNAFKNVGLSLVALLSPVSTLKVALGEAYWKVFAALWVGLLGSLQLLGLRIRVRRGEWRIPVLLCLLFLGNQGPALLMNHITEGNVSRSLAFGVILLGYCLYPLWEQGSRVRKRVLAGALVVWLVFSIAAIHGKVSGIKQVHSNAANFRKEVQRLLPVPPDRRVVFVAERTQKGYGEYQQPLWMALPGDADLGLINDYGPSYKGGDVILVESLSHVPDSVKQVDFLVDRIGKVTRNIPSETH